MMTRKPDCKLVACDNEGDSGCDGSKCIKDEDHCDSALLGNIFNFNMEQINPKNQHPKRSSWNILYDIILMNIGFGLTMLGCITIIYPILDLTMNDLIKMRPNSPSFLIWSKYQPELLAKVYLFNVTNSEEFITGKSSKLEINEIGPIIYREHSKYTNIVRHLSNSTLSYTVERQLEFVPEYNKLNILNETMIVPNLPLLVMATHLQDYLFFVKMIFNRASETDRIFLNTTIYNLLWNCTTPALQKTRKYFPSNTPIDNAGILFNAQRNPIDRINVNIGELHGFKNFFKINTVNDRQYSLGYYPERNDCPASIINSSDGAFFSNYITKNQTLETYRKTSCRKFQFVFEKEIAIGWLNGHQYNVALETFDRLANLSGDCFKGFGSEIYPNGIYDASKCYAGSPIAFSLPHFYGRKGPWNYQIKGLQPAKAKHLSNVVIEPVIGFPLQQEFRIQINFKFPKLTGFSDDIKKFSEFIVPQCWFEYNMKEVTPVIKILVITVVNILPIGQYVISGMLLVAGLWLILLATKRLRVYNSFQRLWLTRCFFKIKHNVIL